MPFQTRGEKSRLKDLEDFKLTDTGTHILDIARFYLGEAHKRLVNTIRQPQYTKSRNGS